MVTILLQNIHIVIADCNIFIAKWYEGNCNIVRRFGGIIAGLYLFTFNE